MSFIYLSTLTDCIMLININMSNFVCILRLHVSIYTIYVFIVSQCAQVNYYCLCVCVTAYNLCVYIVYMGNYSDVLILHTAW